ncbi:hypothetical protein [uncultured Photobacterium sp.]|uniref:FtsX-like permease family protein n=1 Tax=uncultured Photobacterium sp. TaxID=173973 RepID=UPI002631FBE2|nr:hypothetical protein [uncultured Photobacterium sp.]
MGTLALPFLLMKSRLFTNWHSGIVASVFVSCTALILLMVLIWLDWVIELANDPLSLIFISCLIVICCLVLVVMLFYHISRIITCNAKLSVAELYAFKIMGLTQKELLLVLAIKTALVTSLGLLFAVGIIQLFQRVFSTVIYETLLEHPYQFFGFSLDWLSLGYMTILILSFISMISELNSIKKVRVSG